MGTNEFKKGYLEYQVTHLAADFAKYDWTLWKDGFLAFSGMERRFDKEKDPALIPSLLSGKNQKTRDGYLMEMNLWGSPEKGVFREIVLEREETTFLVQDWTLFPDTPEVRKSNAYAEFLQRHSGESRNPGFPDEAECNCYFAKAETRPPTDKNDPNKAKKKYIFTTNDLKSIEVVIPETRLHFFITTGGK